MKKFLKEKLVKEIMTKKVYSVHMNEPVDKILRLFADNKIMSLPVLDNDKKVCGIITQRDVDLKFEKLEAPLSINLLGSVLYLSDLDEFNLEVKKKLGQFAVDIMTAPALTINEDASLQDVLKLMDNNNVFRIPVVNSNEELVGIVTNTDIIKELIKEGNAL
jgi:CBS domain-containing protein